MNAIHPIAKKTELDCLSEEQLLRISTRPLESDQGEFAEFGSFKGRGVILIQLGHTLVREPYRFIKNLFIIAERIILLFRTLIECLFKEHPFEAAKKAGRDLLSGIGALPLRLVTYALDILKLFVGLFIPAAAIHFNPGRTT